MNKERFISRKPDKVIRRKLINIAIWDGDAVNIQISFKQLGNWKTKELMLFAWEVRDFIDMVKKLESFWK